MPILRSIGVGILLDETDIHHILKSLGDVAIFTSIDEL